MDTDETETWVTASGHQTSRRFRSALNPVESRAELRLKEVTEKFKVAQSKYDFLNNKMNYCKRLYQGAGNVYPSVDSQLTEIHQQSITDVNFSYESIRNSQTNVDGTSKDQQTSGDTREYYDVCTESKNIQRQNESAKDKPSSLTILRTNNSVNPVEPSSKSSARSFVVSSRQNVFPEAPDENSSDSGRQNYFSEESKSHERKDSIDVNKQPGNTSHLHIETQIRREANEITTTRQQLPYQLHLAEYSIDLQEELEKESNKATSPLALEDQTKYGTENIITARSVKKLEKRKPELLPNISGSTESARKSKIVKMKNYRKVSSNVTTMNRNLGAITKQADNTIGVVSRVRRKKRRLKASNSRSTTATRDTNFLEITKDTRKQKRAHATIPASQLSHHRRDSATKIEQNLSDVVEIYHNTAAVKSGSISVVSSKHLKLEPSRRRNITSANQRSKIKENSEFINNRTKRNKRPRTQDRRALEREKNSQQRIGDEIIQDLKTYQQSSQNNTDSRPKQIYEQNPSAVESQNKVSEEYNDHQPRCRIVNSPDQTSTYYDSLAIRNYELPTLASKMKRVNRSYFHRFNFRNIPFVVGTSVTPSYNLGLNIQETLSLLKTRQTMLSGMTPLLISNVSKGLRPIRSIMGMTHQDIEDPSMTCEMSSYPRQISMGEKTISTPMQLGRFSLQPSRLTCAPTKTRSFYAAQQIHGNENSENATTRKRQATSSIKYIERKIGEDHAELTQSALLRQRQKELNIGDSGQMCWQDEVRNSRGIQSVLINFHNQLEALLNLKDEKLKAQAKNPNDKTLQQEIDTLEKELNIKEEEISEIVGLYMEVKSLKQQMRMLQEKNSLICVATELPGSPVYPYISTGANTTDPMRMINMYRTNAMRYNRGPSTSTRLAGLLRQIKTFQQELKTK